MKISALTTLAVALLISTSNLAAERAKKVSSVSSVSVTILKTAPRWLEIKASGTVPTGGWTSGSLSLIPTTVPPADGIYAFDFIATPPSGTVTQVVTPISVDPPHVWKGYPAGLKGVKVVSASNCMIALLPGVDTASVNSGTCSFSK